MGTYFILNNAIYNTRQGISKLSVSIHAVRSWEQDKSSPPYETLIKICNLYAVSADFLLGLTDRRPSYMSEKTFDKLTSEELSELSKYKDFLIWKRKK